jgi:hypothetical protein
MSQQQRQQLGLSAKPSTQPGLQLGTAEQQLLAAWEIVQGACSILLLSASPLVSLVLAAHLEKKSAGRGNKARKASGEKVMMQTTREIATLRPRRNSRFFLNSRERLRLAERI